MRKKFLKYIKISVLTISLIGVLFYLLVYFGCFGKIHKGEALKSFQNELASIVYSSDNFELGTYYTINRTNTTFDEIPQHTIEALVATEDFRFFNHSGVDYNSLLRVLVKSILLGDSRAGGGSTLTQQLAKNMYGRGNYGLFSMPVNKTKEIIQAKEIEAVFTKNEIITLYLNTVSFGDGVFGIATAAKRFFNKPVSELTIQESAVLVGILKANTFYNPQRNKDNALKRRSVVLSQMNKYGYISEKEKDSLVNLDLVLDYQSPNFKNSTAYFLAHVKKETAEIVNNINAVEGTSYDIEKDGLKIYTTLDYGLQKKAFNSLKLQLTKMQQRLAKQYASKYLKQKLNKKITHKLKQLDISNEEASELTRLSFDWKANLDKKVSRRDSLIHEVLMLHGGLLGLSPDSGAITTWVGGVNYQTHPYDQVLAKRQMASTFKPILYASAIEKGLMPCDYISNRVDTLEAYDNWSPKNANHESGGEYSLTGALINSKNVPAVHLFFETGFDKVSKLWEDLQFSSTLKDSPTVALGVTDASIYELARAYASFANGGKQIDAFAVTKITTFDGDVLYERSVSEEVIVLSENTTSLLNHVLQQAIERGTGKRIRSTYGIKMPLAGKTGTSQNYADAWFACYNPSIVMVSRVGASSPDIHFTNGNGSGSSLALPIVAKTLQAIERSPKRNALYSSDFTSLSTMEEVDLDCLDFVATPPIEDCGFNGWSDSFNRLGGRINRFIFGSKEKKEDEKQEKKAKKSKGFFGRLFGR